MNKGFATVAQLAEQRFCKPQTDSISAGVATTYGSTENVDNSIHDSCEISDPDLRSIVEAWPTLPEAVRAGIMAFVQACDTDGGDRRDGDGQTS